MQQEILTSLLEKKQELMGRLARIQKHVGIPLDQDSKEASTQVQNDEVLSLLDNEAREELMAIDIAIKRFENGVYTICAKCNTHISKARLEANPFCNTCIDCSKDTRRLAG